MNIKYVILIVAVAFSCKQNREEEYVEYHSNDKVALSGNTVNGLKVGKWVRYDSLGDKIREFEYDSGILIKRYIYSNGYLFAEEEMKGEDYKHGLTLTFYENGAVRSENSFKENRQSGEQTYYLMNGSVETKFIETDSGIINFAQYYPNGNLMVKANSLVNGEINMYDSLGNKLYDLLYRDAVVVDTLKVY